MSVFKRLVSLLCGGIVTVGLCVGDAEASIIFADNFDNTTGTTSSLNDDLAVRQSGSYVADNGTVNWSTGGVGAAQRRSFQNRGQELQTDLQRTADSTTGSSRTWAYLNQDFSSDLGAIYSASFDISMEVFTAGGVPSTDTALNNTVLRFHLNTTAARAESGVASGRDFDLGFSPYYNTVNDEWTLRTTAFVKTGADTFTTSFVETPITLADVAGEFYTPTATLTILIDEIENTFSVSVGAISVFADVDLQQSLTSGTGRYFGFQSIIAHNAPSTTILQHKVDNFSIIPEPGTLGLVLLGLGMAWRVRRKMSFH